MYTTKLEVVNACLATMGEAPLNMLDDEHAYKQAALNYLDASNRTVQKAGLWFNAEYITLQPQVPSGFIMIPTGTIDIVRPTRYHPDFAQRGNRLYDPVHNTYIWTKGVEVALVTLLDFEDCPFDAQDSISMNAVYRFQREYDGDQARTRDLDRDRMRADAQLNAKNTRELKPNLLLTLSNRFRRARIGFPGTAYTGGPALGYPNVTL